MARIESKAYDPNIVALRGSGTIITVDPINGNDSEFNNGTVTPLKTLDALFKRLPVYTTGQVDTNFNTLPILVILASGSHSFTRTQQGFFNDGEALYLPSMIITGVTASLSSFVVDHYTNVCHVFQTASNPAWTTNQFQGDFLYVNDGGFPEYFPILANGSFDLTVGWSPNNTSAAGGDSNWFYPFSAPLTGSTVQIVQLVSKIVGPSALNLCSLPTNINGVVLQLLHFDGTINNVDKNLIMAGGGEVISCRFSSGALGNTFFSGDQEIDISHCLFDNNPTVRPMHVYGNAVVGFNLSFVNCASCIRPEFGANFTYQNSAFHAPDTLLCIAPNRASVNVVEAGTRVNVSATFINGDGVSAPVDINWTQSSITVLENMVPKTWLALGACSRAVLDTGFNVATSVASGAFSLDNGNTLLSVADWIADGKSVESGNGARIVAYTGSI